MSLLDGAAGEQERGDGRRTARLAQEGPGCGSGELRLPGVCLICGNDTRFLKGDN